MISHTLLQYLKSNGKKNEIKKSFLTKTEKYTEKIKSSIKKKIKYIHYQYLKSTESQHFFFHTMCLMISSIY